MMRRTLRASEAADVIERFLDGKELYPQEWNDFIEGMKVEQQAEPFRKRCYELDPLINRPGGPDPKALEELRNLLLELRKI
jgi:hypothetical protein